jgi:coproporphyrinogen III oxidase-like Fe-S oxidoreductase
MKLRQDKLFPFDRFLPIYNWYYPLHTNPVPLELEKYPQSVFKQLSTNRVKSRALYFHIPFCDTICSFCPFTRTRFSDRSLVAEYLEALLQEIAIKGAFESVASIPVGAIFVGGGTPSILAPDEILRFGRAIHETFDLTQLQEFSVEIEVKSLTPEKLAAFHSIGVTHCRFGLQTFNPRYRDYFDLTATLDQIYEAIELLPTYFEYNSFDILYGMDGQSVDEFFEDIKAAVATGFKQIDFYPINNLVTQRKLHRKFEAAHLPPTSGEIKFWMNIALRELMQSSGYLPHNGHGYVKVPSGSETSETVVTDTYSFRYHEYVYGYEGYDLLGFGTNAISSLLGVTLRNTSSRSRYIESLTKSSVIPMKIGMHSSSADANRGIILRLPYHGRAAKKLISWTSIADETLRALDQAIQHGLVEDDGEELRLTRSGWNWYVNLMYFLAPTEERHAIDFLIKQNEIDKKRVGNMVAPDALSRLNSSR